MARRTKQQIQKDKFVKFIAQKAVMNIPINIMSVGVIYKKAEAIADENVLTAWQAVDELRKFVETLRVA